MKAIESVYLPEDLRYSVDHEWVRVGEEGLVQVGITDYAQDQLGDVVYVELPKLGARLAAGAVFATVESVKSVSECYLPLAGEIVAVNDTLVDDPALINRSPYGEGWMVLLRPDEPTAIAALLSAEAYRAGLAGDA
jgi:glycine cleavage system H protein